MPNELSDAREAVRRLTIIYVGLFFSPLAMLAVIRTMTEGEAARPLEKVLPLVIPLGAVALVNVVLSFVLPSRIVKAQGQSVYMLASTVKIISFALAESAGLMVVVLYMLSHRKELLLGLAVPYLALLAHRPTEEGVEELARKFERGGGE